MISWRPLGIFDRSHHGFARATAKATKKGAEVGKFVVARQKLLVQRRTHLLVSTNDSMSDTILSSSGA
jgi:hypothetical protein